MLRRVIIHSAEENVEGVKQPRKRRPKKDILETGENSNAIVFHNTTVEKEQKRKRRKAGDTKGNTCPNLSM